MYTLHLGDCLEIMPTLPSGSIDAIITDLPYGTTACKWDTVIPFEPMWKEVKRVLRPNGAFITTASQPFTSALVVSNLKWFKYELIWNKMRGYGAGVAKYRPMMSFENIVIFAKGKTIYNPQMHDGVPYKKTNSKKDNRKENHRFGYKPNYISVSNGTRYPLSVLEFSWSPSKTLHSTQKPVALYEYLIRTYTNEGETVLDICIGSGTTIEAAERTGRNSIGIEKDEGIYKTAVERLSRTCGEERM